MNVKKRWTGESQYHTRVTKIVQKKTKGEHRHVQRSRDVISNMLKGTELANGTNGINAMRTYINESAVSTALFRIPAASSSPKWWKQMLKIRHSFFELAANRGTARASTGLSI